jgi:spermidine synthase
MKQLPKYVQYRNGEWWLTESERDNMTISYRVRSIVHEEQSPFQHVMILDSCDFGRMLVLDGVVQTTSMDGFIYNEMISHVPLAFHPHPRRVLVIGGGDCGAAREVCKHDQVEQIDLVEIDQAVVEACKRHLPEVSGNLSDPRVRFIYADGVEFVKSVSDTYDVIIVDSSDPVGPAKPLFEYAFYAHLHRALKADGVMVCQSQSPIFHDDVMRQTYQHIDRLFPTALLYTAVVPTYPGGLWSFTLGSKAYERPARFHSFNKETRYVNREILEQCFRLPTFIKDRIAVKVKGGG